MHNIIIIIKKMFSPCCSQSLSLGIYVTTLQENISTQIQKIRPNIMFFYWAWCHVVLEPRNQMYQSQRKGFNKMNEMAEVSIPHCHYTRKAAATKGIITSQPKAHKIVKTAGSLLHQLQRGAARGATRGAAPGAARGASLGAGGL